MRPMCWCVVYMDRNVRVTGLQRSEEINRKIKPKDKTIYTACRNERLSILRYIKSSVILTRGYRNNCIVYRDYHMALLRRSAATAVSVRLQLLSGCRLVTTTATQEYPNLCDQLVTTNRFTQK